MSSLFPCWKNRMDSQDLNIASIVLHKSWVHHQIILQRIDKMGLGYQGSPLCTPESWCTPLRLVKGEQ